MLCRRFYAVGWCRCRGYKGWVSSDAIGGDRRLRHGPRKYAMARQAATIVIHRVLPQWPCSVMDPEDIEGEAKSAFAKTTIKRPERLACVTFDSKYAKKEQQL